MICPVCNSKNISFAFTCDNYEEIFDVEKCIDCECFFQKKNGNVKLEKLYQEEYYSGNANYSYHDERKTFYYDNFVWQARIKSIRKFQKNARTFLDVGCAFGGFTQAASKHFESYGVDLSHFAVLKGNQWANENKFIDEKFKGIYEGSLMNFPEELVSKKFDIVSLIEVAEHLSNPRKEFKKAFEILNSSGVLVIQTANFEGWQAINQGQNYHYFMPGHLVYFRATALKTLLKDIGFKQFKEFFPVDFSLFVKLRKSRGHFDRPWDYLKWFKISYYHLKSKFWYKGNPLTSSYVLYAKK